MHHICYIETVHRVFYIVRGIPVDSSAFISIESCNIIVVMSGVFK